MVKKEKIITGAAIVLVCVPLIVAAATSLPPPPLSDLKFQDVLDILNKLVTWVFTVFLIIAVIFIIIAAFRYLASSGSPEGVKAATKALTFAAVAIVVAMLSVGVRSLVQELLGTQISNTTTAPTQNTSPVGDPNFPY